MERIVIDSRKVGPAISPLLFGHNLEHTRNCIHKGLSAQILRNRKFANRAQTDGSPMEWYRIGPSSVYLLVHDYEPYVHHYDPKMRARRKDETHCLKIENAKGVRGGIGQEKIALQKGVKYEFRIAARSIGKVRLSIEIRNYAGTKTYFKKVVIVNGKEWKKHVFNLVSPVTSLDAKLELTFTDRVQFEIGMVSFMPADNFHGMRKDVIEDLRAIGPAVLRWPGGDFAGDYRWQDGLIDVDQRAALQSQMYSTNVHSVAHDSHEIGTDEFMALCRELNAEPYITLNIGWEGVELCLAWHEYCNGSVDTKWGKLRAQRGHPEPYNVKFWSLGNEMGSDHMEGPDNEIDYPRAVLPIGKALQKADPDIWICISGHYGKKEWYSSFKKLAPHFDAWAYHMYFTMPMNMVKGRRKFEYEWAAERDPRWGLDEDLPMYKKRMKEISPKGKDMQVAFDEWNAWGCWHRDPVIADGMLAAGILNRLVRKAAELNIKLGCYFEPVNEGAIIVEPFSSRLTNIGKVFKHWKEHAGNSLVDVKGRKRKYIDVTASKNLVTGKTVVTVINSSFDRNFKIKLAPDSGEMRDVTITTLWARDHLPGTYFSEKVVRVKEADALNVSLPKFTCVKIVYS